MSFNRKTVSTRQFEILVEFLSLHKDLALGRLKSRDARQCSKQLWQEIANLLNAEGGLSKTGAQWNKWYTDYKSRLIGRHRKIKHNQMGTGGGLGQYVSPLSEHEIRLCAVLGVEEQCQSGNESLASVRICPEILQDNLRAENIEHPDLSAIDDRIEIPVFSPFCVEEDAITIANNEKNIAISLRNVENIPTDGQSEEPNPSRVIKSKRKYPITKSKKAKCTKKEEDITQLEQSRQVLIDIENARIAAEERSAAAEERSAAALSQIADAISTMAQAQTRIAVAIENLYNLQQR